MAEETVRVLRIEVGDSQKTVKGLRKEIGELRDSLLNIEKGSAEYDKVVERLIDDERKLADVMGATKRATTAAEGSYNALQMRLKQLRNEWKMTTNEARRAELGKEIAQINTKLKDMDASIGNYQRNVGNYQSAWGNFTGALSKGLGVVSVAAAGAATSFKLLEAILVSTQTTGDTLAHSQARWAAGWDYFKRSIAVGDFSGFLDGLKNVLRATDQLSDALDNAFELGNQARLLNADSAQKIAELDEQFRNTALSNEERAKAGRELLEERKKAYAIEIQSATALRDAYLDNVVAALKLTDAEKELFTQKLRTWSQDEELRKQAYKLIDARRQLAAQADSKNYNAALAGIYDTSPSPVSKKRNAELQKELEAVINTAPTAVQEYARFLQAYDMGNDEIINGYVRSEEELSKASTAAYNENRRIITSLNALDDTSKEVADKMKARRQEIEAEFGKSFDPAVQLKKIEEWYKAGEITASQYAQGVKTYTENESVLPNIISFDREEAMKALDERIEFNGFIVKADKNLAEESSKLVQKQIKETQEAEEKKLKAREMGLAATAQLAGNMSSILGEETAAGKSFAVAQATMDTYAAGLQVFKDPTFTGQPWARFAAMAATITAGLVQVKNILSVNTSGGTQSGGTGGGSLVSPPRFVAEPVTYTRNVQTDSEIEQARQTPVVKAYVVEKELTEKQREALAKKNNATF